jgi:hypothetical protein
MHSFSAIAVALKKNRGKNQYRRGIACPSLPFGTTGIRRDNHSLLEIGDMVADVFHHQGTADQVIHRAIKESLEL